VKAAVGPGRRTGEKEAVLVRRAMAGDSVSFGQLVEIYQRAVYALLLSRVGDCETARDLAQDVFIRAWVGLRRLTSPDAFAPWIYGIARNLCADHYRRRKDFVDLEDAMRVAGSDSSLVVPQPDVENLILRRKVLEAIGTLPAKSQEAILLHYVDERSYEEIASMLSVPVGVIRSRLEYGRIKLKKELLDMVKETLQERSPGPEFKGKVLDHVSGVKSVSPCLSSLAEVFRYRARQINEHMTTRALTDEVLAAMTGDAFRFYYGTDPSIRYLCSYNLLVAACESFGLTYKWSCKGSYEESWKILRAAIDDGTPALVAYRPTQESQAMWTPMPGTAIWGLAVGYDRRTRAVVLAPPGRLSPNRLTETLDDFPDRWEGWSPGPEGWVKYPVFVPGEPGLAPRRVSFLEHALQLLGEGEITIAGKKLIGGVAGLEAWAAALREGHIYAEAKGEHLDALAAATLEMTWLLRPSRRAAAMFLFGRSAHHEGEVRSLLRKAAGIFLDVSEPLASGLEETLTETPEIRDDPEHEVSHLEVTKACLHNAKARVRGAELIERIAGLEREAMDCFREVVLRENSTRANQGAPKPDVLSPRVERS
jgi:RNA polymerase sigma-70 factor, ECF subfamily